MADINEKHLTVNGVDLRVHDTEADGDPVVLIHGWPLNADSWAHQIDTLDHAGYRVIAYDRRGFGGSEKPNGEYDYDTLSDDLAELLEQLNLENATIVGFSMGGGEVARYISRHGEDRLKAAVFASAVPPFLLKSDDNPDGPLDEATANEFKTSLERDPTAFYDDFTKGFFSANADGKILVTEDERQDALKMCAKADKMAALATMEAWATTDFRRDLNAITVPTLVLHGDSDGTVPFEGSGKRTHEAISNSQLHVINGGPHGINASHADEFNRALLDFLDQ